MDMHWFTVDTEHGYKHLSEKACNELCDICDKLDYSRVNLPVAPAIGSMILIYDETWRVVGHLYSLDDVHDTKPSLEIQLVPESGFKAYMKENNAY